MLAVLPQLIIALAALTASIAILVTVQRYGRQALAIRDALRDCTGVSEVRWSVVTHGTIRPVVQHRITQAVRPMTAIRQGVVRAAA